MRTTPLLCGQGLSPIRHFRNRHCACCIKLKTNNNEGIMSRKWLKKLNFSFFLKLKFFIHNNKLRSYSDAPWCTFLRSEHVYYKTRWEMFLTVWKYFHGMQNKTIPMPIVLIMKTDLCNPWLPDGNVIPSYLSYSESVISKRSHQPLSSR